MYQSISVILKHRIRKLLQIQWSYFVDEVMNPLFNVGYVVSGFDGYSEPCG